MDHYNHSRTYIYKVKANQNTVYISSTNTTTKTDLINVGGDIEPEDEISGEYVDPDVVTREVWNGKDLWTDETVEWRYEGVYSNTLFTMKAQNVIDNHDPKKVSRVDFFVTPFRGHC